MAKKPYKLWDVYIVGEGCGVYSENYSREFVGQTRAVSEKQACNNVRFSLRDKKMPNGGYANWYIDDIRGEGFVHFHFEAKEVV